jgi:hypothetical protein
MIFDRLRPLVAAILLSTAVAACETGAPLATQPTANAPADVGTVPTTPVSPATPTVSTNPDSVLRSELARIAVRAQAEAIRYDSLKVLWQAVLDDTTGRYADSLMCDPKQYVATAKIVGPEGADINFGEHTLRIPRGALSARTVITAEAPTSLRSLAVFSPHGTQFNPASRPTLELSYKHCRGAVNRVARIAYLGANGQILEWPPSQDFPELGLVRGIISHFSNYIVAY